MDAYQLATVLRIAWTTVETVEDAEALARKIVESKLAACAQIDGPIHSVYPWKGEIESAREYRLWVKYPEENENALRECVQRFHPYEVPQWISVDAASASDGYLEWVLRECP